MVASDWVPVTRGGIPSYNAFNRPIEKSQQDTREYRIIRLDNGLHATLIHDAQADKAAASLDIAVGHLYDPVSNSFDATTSGVVAVILIEGVVGTTTSYLSYFQ
jgi:hypothetical protein